MQSEMGQGSELEDTDSAANKVLDGRSGIKSPLSIVAGAPMSKLTRVMMMPLCRLGITTSRFPENSTICQRHQFAWVGGRCATTQVMLWQAVAAPNPNQHRTYLTLTLTLARTRT